MDALILGGGGMLGRKLAESFAADSPSHVQRLSLVDAFIEPSAPAGCSFTVDCSVADITDPQVTRLLVAERPDLIFHLAAIVSGEAELDFDKGYSINLDGTRNLFEAIRSEGDDYCPRVVFTSSIAVFGAPFPAIIDDEFILQPLTSYGAQKVIGEVLLNDYSRRGIFDGIGLRLPSICVRPGAANKAASGLFSNIIREPLSGRDVVLPAARSTRHWFASPRSAVHFLRHAATLDTRLLGARRCLNMPGLSATIAEEIDALRRIAGDAVVQRIHDEPDELIMRIVAGWPSNFTATRARELGFSAETSFEEIINVFIEDELGGQLA
jgi:nucleoside-diphosphate-sugar epimerase